jgi:hypothetical protein
MWWRRTSGCLNLRYQASHKESHISKCQSLFNQDIKWFGDQKWKLIIRLKYSKSQPPKSQWQNKIKCDNPHEVKKRWNSNNHLVQAQVEEIYFIFNLEYKYATLSRGMLYRLSTKSHAQQKAKYPSEMSETQWLHTLHIALNQEKPNGSVSQTEVSGLGRWAPTASF